MIPDYFKFIRFQDKRILPFFYFILWIVLGFYWKNNDYRLTSADAWPVAVILAITLFNLIYELKSYWAYSCVIGRSDVDSFEGKTCSPALAFFTRPTVVSVIAVGVFWLLVQACLRLPSAIYSTIALFLASPLLAFLVFRALRPVYITQVLTRISSGVKYKNLVLYVACFVVLTVMVNVLSISPLKANVDFSLRDGFFSAKLMVAMLILCAVVLAINLVFVRLSKRYIFLGRVFLKEIDFFFSKGIPCSSLHEKSFLVRMLLLLVVQCVWIVLVSILFTLMNVPAIFEVYYVCCALPCIGYYFLHLYWHWHSEFLTCCDMYFRYEEIKKRDN
ncbi:hypothetical protein GWD52_02700 [Enterobacteriaceae bacterium 4M9]|nr:hypothetical protein [Enterobacteriaceae bacterium 4M9]